jgi:hypothetical protein
MRSIDEYFFGYFFDDFFFGFEFYGYYFFDGVGDDDGFISIFYYIDEM